MYARNLTFLFVCFCSFLINPIVSSEPTFRSHSLFPLFFPLLPLLFLFVLTIFFLFSFLPQKTHPPSIARTHTKNYVHGYTLDKRKAFTPPPYTHPHLLAFKDAYSMYH